MCSALFRRREPFIPSMGVITPERMRSKRSDCWLQSFASSVSNTVNGASLRIKWKQSRARRRLLFCSAHKNTDGKSAIATPVKAVRTLAVFLISNLRYFFHYTIKIIKTQPKMGGKIRNFLKDSGTVSSCFLKATLYKAVFL